ncbi:MAG: hypothetical protein JXA46_07345 [Dehalococcoidales bacterium]|nr:hypothetical protein [Dehalococcoidales bacterium]
MANLNKFEGPSGENAEIEHLKQRIELLDDRLDNIDSVLTAVAERIMKQPVTISLTCPHCGKTIEVSLVGQQKPTSQ